MNYLKIFPEKKFKKTPQDMYNTILQICSLYLDKNQINFYTEPHNDNFSISFSRKKKKTVEMIFQTQYCTFEISAKPFLTNFLSFLAQSRERLIKSKKISKKLLNFVKM